MMPDSVNPTRSEESLKSTAVFFEKRNIMSYSTLLKDVNLYISKKRPGILNYPSVRFDSVIVFQRIKHKAHDCQHQQAAKK